MDLSKKEVKVGMKFPVPNENPPDTGRIVQAKVVKLTTTKVKSVRMYEDYEVKDVASFVQDMIDRYSTKNLRISRTRTGAIVVNTNETYWQIEQEG